MNGEEKRKGKRERDACFGLNALPLRATLHATDMAKLRLLIRAKAPGRFVFGGLLSHDEQTQRNKIVREGGRETT